MTTRTLVLMAALGLGAGLLALSGCAAGHGATAAESTGDLATCPVVLVATTISDEDVGGGTSLVFTSSDPAAVEALRSHVRHLAALHDDHHRADGARVVDFQPRAERDPLGTALGAGTSMPASTATAEDVEGGARLVLHAADPQEVAALRDQARLQAGRLPGWSCQASPTAAAN